ncbi:MAG: NAD(P)H-dependent oxidoreductase [Eubacteriales bacterium]
MESIKIGVFVGSLRKESFTGKIASALSELAPAGFVFERVRIDGLPMYNQDLDDSKTPPAQWEAFRDSVKKYDAVLFLTPEYNRSVPAVLKNALDVGSRPYGKSVWSGKPGAVVSVTPGALGAFGANHHLRQSLVFLNIPTMQQPEAYIGNASALFDTDGILINEGTRDFLQKFIDSYVSWVVMNLHKC